MPSLTELKAVCWKHQGEKFKLSQYGQRYVSIQVTRLCIALGLKGNTVTLISLFCMLGASLLLFLPMAYNLVAAGILIYLYSLLDHVDGEVARYNVHIGRQRAALDGAYFDLLIHNFSINLFYLALGLFLMLHLEHWLYFAAGTAALLGFSSFPRQVLAQVLIQNQQKQGDFLSSPKLTPLLLGFAPHRPDSSRLKWFKSLVGELVFFPGCLYVSALLLVTEGLFPSLSHYPLRVYLLALAGAVSFNTIRTSFRIIRKLATVPPAVQGEQGEVS